MKPDHFFGGRASPVSGACAHFWGLCLPFAELPSILSDFWYPLPYLSGSYHTLFCALRRGIITRRGDGDGVLPWFLCHSPSYDYPAAWDASHYLLQNYTPFGSGVLLCGILFLLRCWMLLLSADYSLHLDIGLITNLCSVSIRSLIAPIVSHDTTLLPSIPLGHRARIPLSW